MLKIFGSLFSRIFSFTLSCGSGWDFCFCFTFLSAFFDRTWRLILRVIRLLFGGDLRALNEHGETVIELRKDVRDHVGSAGEFLMVSFEFLVIADSFESFGFFRSSMNFINFPRLLIISMLFCITLLCIFRMLEQSVDWSSHEYESFSLINSSVTLIRALLIVLSSSRILHKSSSERKRLPACLWNIEMILSTTAMIESSGNGVTVGCWNISFYKPTIRIEIICKSVTWSTRRSIL